MTERLKLVTIAGVGFVCTVVVVTLGTIVPMIVKTIAAADTKA